MWLDQKKDESLDIVPGLMRNQAIIECGVLPGCYERRL